MKYGNINTQVPDISQEVDALRDLLQKEEITRAKFNREMAKLQSYRMSYIISTNGGYTLGKKSLKQMTESINRAKQKHQAMKQQADRNQFLDEISKLQQPPTDTPTDTPE